MCGGGGGNGPRIPGGGGPSIGGKRNPPGGGNGGIGPPWGGGGPPRSCGPRSRNARSMSEPARRSGGPSMYGTNAPLPKAKFYVTDNAFS